MHVLNNGRYTEATPKINKEKTDYQIGNRQESEKGI